MININQSTVYSTGEFVSIETLNYMYPTSLLQLQYNLGNGNKTHFIKVGFDSKGQRFVKSKNPIAKRAQQLICNDFFNVYSFITKF